MRPQLCIAIGLKYLGRSDVAVADVLQHYIDRPTQCHMFNLADAFAQAMGGTSFDNAANGIRSDVEAIINHIMETERE